MTHASYVFAAYAVSALGIGGLFLWALLDQMTQQRSLRDLEERGVRRRSQRKAEGGSLK